MPSRPAAVSAGARRVGGRCRSDVLLVQFALVVFSHVNKVSENFFLRHLQRFEMPRQMIGQLK